MTYGLRVFDSFGAPTLDENDRTQLAIFDGSYSVVISPGLPAFVPYVVNADEFVFSEGGLFPQVVPGGINFYTITAIIVPISITINFTIFRI